jgi:hypothetical protein
MAIRVRSSSEFKIDNCVAHLFHTPGAAWIAFVAALRTSGFAVPLEMEPGCPADYGQSRWLLAFSGPDGAPRFGIPINASWSRAAPSFRILRVPRFGESIPLESVGRIARILQAVGRKKRALRLHVAIYDPDLAAHRFRAGALHQLGFRPWEPSLSYTQTVLIDLRRTEEALLASFHATCRRHIRAFDKGGLQCRAITDQSLADRMNLLLRESMDRTGGRFTAVDWPKWIAFIATNPFRAHLLGVFRGDRSGPDALIAYVLGCRHDDDTVEYSIAASTRSPDLKVPLHYAPTWQLIRWARDGGAAWFDFGGLADNNPAHQETAGIARFKRYFSENVVQVGSEHVLEPILPPVRLGALISSAAAVVARLVHRRGAVAAGQPENPR